jgi:hypothetical protein
MSNLPEQQSSDELERRRQLRQKGWSLCLEGVGVIALGGVFALLSQWLFDTGKMGFGIIAVGALLVFIAPGLVNIVKGRDRSGGTVPHGPD